MRKQPYTTAELFNIVNNSLEEKGLLPDILDYGLPEHSEIFIKDYGWDLIGIVNFGSSEGIYLDLFCVGETGNPGRNKVRVGTYKTLYETKEAFKSLGALNAEFVYEVKDFVKSHFEDFDRKE